MIAFLRGEVIETYSESIVLSVQNVGYEVSVLPSVLDMRGEQISLWVHTQVREDAISLFGFIQPQEKAFFMSLLKVNGIGPKLALNAMSGASADLIAELIESEDVKGLTQLPKVGKKTAEQMILTLKGKLPRIEGSSRVIAYEPARPHREITSALTNLGFKVQDVEKVVLQFPPTIEFQEGVKLGLAALAQIR
jgi:Holliday junction DNA helicase RuvA